MSFQILRENSLTFSLCKLLVWRPSLSLCDSQGVTVTTSDILFHVEHILLGDFSLRISGIIDMVNEHLRFSNCADDFSGRLKICNLSLTFLEHTDRLIINISIGNLLFLYLLWLADCWSGTDCFSIITLFYYLRNTFFVHFKFENILTLFIAYGHGFTLLVILNLRTFFHRILVILVYHLITDHTDRKHKQGKEHLAKNVIMVLIELNSSLICLNSSHNTFLGTNLDKPFNQSWDNNLQSSHQTPHIFLVFG